MAEVIHSTGVRLVEKDSGTLKLVTLDSSLGKPLEQSRHVVGWSEYPLITSISLQSLHDIRCECYMILQRTLVLHNRFPRV